MTKRKKSRRWLQQQRSDPHVRQAKADGWRSRAACKLIEIDDKVRLLKGKKRILELGAAPGSWTQVVRQRLPDATVVCVDRLAMDPVPGAVCIQGDCADDATCEKIDQSMQGMGCDCLLSDMAPNITGLEDVDAAGWRDTVNLIFQFIDKKLQKNGDCCFKLFHGPAFKATKTQLDKAFKRVSVIKPAASKAKSREVYLFACGYSGILGEWDVDSNEEEAL